MTRKQLEHVIRASGAIAEVDRLVIIGSQALLGLHPEAPEGHDTEQSNFS